MAREPELPRDQARLERIDAECRAVIEKTFAIRGAYRQILWTRQRDEPLLIRAIAEDNLIRVTSKVGQAGRPVEIDGCLSPEQRDEAAAAMMAFIAAKSAGDLAGVIASLEAYTRVIERLRAEVRAAQEELDRPPEIRCPGAKVWDYFKLIGRPRGLRGHFMERLRDDGIIEGEPDGRYAWRFRFKDADLGRRFQAWLDAGCPPAG
jgi:hypothetical protein